MKLSFIILMTILATGCGGYGSNTPTTPTGATPQIATLTPNSTGAGAAAFTLTVNGTAFTSASIVYFNGAAQPTTFTNATQVTAMIPATAVANSGAMPVLVRITTNGQYGQVIQNSNSVDFTVN